MKRNWWEFSVFGVFLAAVVAMSRYGTAAETLAPDLRYIENEHVRLGVDLQSGGAIDVLPLRREWKDRPGSQCLFLCRADRANGDPPRATAGLRR
ncbi:MAG: hypothetical protein R3E01_33925 [Pirellulaceae bacterium]